MEDLSKKSALNSFLGPTFVNSEGVEIEIIASHCDAPPDKPCETVAISDSETLRWTDCLRDDLRHIPLALLYKWLPKFSHEDKQSGRIHPHCVPLDPLMFSKGNKVCWQIYGIVKENHGCYFPLIVAWRVAEFRRGKYVKHRTYEKLSDALTKE